MSVCSTYLNQKFESQLHKVQCLRFLYFFLVNCSLVPSLSHWVLNSFIKEYIWFLPRRFILSFLWVVSTTTISSKNTSDFFRGVLFWVFYGWFGQPLFNLIQVHYCSFIVEPFFKFWCMDLNWLRSLFKYRMNCGCASSLHISFQFFDKSPYPDLPYLPFFARQWVH